MAKMSKARKTARRLIREWRKIQKKAADYTSYMAGSDPWGPSLSDLKDGDQKQEDLVTKIIEQGMK
jgi:hypothetical protein